MKIFAETDRILMREIVNEDLEAISFYSFNLIISPVV